MCIINERGALFIYTSSTLKASVAEKPGTAEATGAISSISG